MQNALALEANRSVTITNAAGQPIRPGALVWRVRHWLGRLLRRAANIVAPLDSYPRRARALEKLA